MAPCTGIGQARPVPLARGNLRARAIALAGSLAIVFLDLSVSDAAPLPAPASGTTAFAPVKGVATYYGRKFAGRRTASGERYDPRACTAAHRTLPFGTLVKVTNTRNGKWVVVRINDRGPHSRGRIIDLSYAAAVAIGLDKMGIASVRLEPVRRPRHAEEALSGTSRRT
jgi:rare lipoprotein A (peptidoglycan hydrolase)